MHSAKGSEELLLPEIERQQQNGKEVAFRADAAFAQPEVYEALEERGAKYALRIPANDSLERDIAERLSGRKAQCEAVGGVQELSLPSRQLLEEWWRRWNIIWGGLSPRVGFLVTNLTLPSRAVVRFYKRSCGSTIREGRQSSGSRKASWR